MPEVYASNEVTAELLDPIDGSVITSVSIPYRRDLTISERPVYAQRGYHRSNTLSAAHLRSLGSVSLRKDADSLALAAEIKRWQKGVVFYALSSDLKGQRYRHPHLRVTFTNADGSTDVVTAYNVKLSDRSLSAPDGGIVGDSISLDVLGGFESKDGGYEPIRALDFHRTGSATVVTSSGLVTKADGQARIGLSYGTYDATKAGLVLEGSFTNSLDNPDAPATQTKSLAAGTYTVYLDGTGSVAVTGTGITTVSGATPATNAIPYTFSLAGTQSITFTVSGSVTRFGCVNLPFRPSHITGTKQADLCGIVPPHNLLKWSDALSNASWQYYSGSGSVTPNATTAPDDTSTADQIALNSAVTYFGQTYSGVIPTATAEAVVTVALTSAWQRFLIVHPDGLTFPIWLKAGTLTKVKVRLVAVAGLGYQCQLTNDALGATGTVYAWGASLVEGYHPGIYVPTTDSPILPPPSPALDPAWSQNGRITGSFVLPSGANVAAGTLILGGGGLTITQKASTIELSRTTAAGTRTLSITKNAADGTPKAFDASWAHYTDSNGVRKMVLTLTVDGTTGTADVAALYGDTAFADLDASRLVSAGSVFATWRDLAPTWPTIPAGSVPAV